MTDYIEFNTEEMANIAAATKSHEAEWDRIWSEVKQRLTATVSAALDARTGSSLEERSAEYHRNTQLYTAQLNAQHLAVHKSGTVATETNLHMRNTIAG